MASLDHNELSNLTFISQAMDLDLTITYIFTLAFFKT